eukprot:3941964-Rhodomonas_salina.4
MHTNTYIFRVPPTHCPVPPTHCPVPPTHCPVPPTPGTPYALPGTARRALLAYHLRRPVLICPRPLRHLLSQSVAAVQHVRDNGRRAYNGDLHLPRWAEQRAHVRHQGRQPGRLLLFMEAVLLFKAAVLLFMEAALFGTDARYRRCGKRSAQLWTHVVLKAWETECSCGTDVVGNGVQLTTTLVLTWSETECTTGTEVVGKECTPGTEVAGNGVQFSCEDWIEQIRSAQKKQKIIVAERTWLEGLSRDL